MRVSRNRRQTGPTREVVEAVYERASHSCEVGGCMVGDRRGVDHHLHHRRPRGAGGSRAADTNSPANLLLVCPSHHEQIESHRGEAYRAGWLVHSMDDPAGTAVLICGERWVHLTHDGKYADGPPRCPECRCDPIQCELDDTGDHCATQACGTCLHGCPLDDCPVCTKEAA